MHIKPLAIMYIIDLMLQPDAPRAIFASLRLIFVGVVQATYAHSLDKFTFADRVVEFDMNEFRIV